VLRRVARRERLVSPFVDLVVRLGRLVGHALAKRIGRADPPRGSAPFPIAPARHHRLQPTGPDRPFDRTPPPRIGTRALRCGPRAMLECMGHTARPAGILLTGGASRRMGFDKTAFPVDGVACAVRIAASLTRVLGLAVEVGSGHTGLPAVREDPPGNGPLAGLCAGLDWLEASGRAGDPVVLVAGDLPFLTDAVLQMLADRAQGSAVPVVDGRAQPLCARWSPESLALGRAARSSGERSMRPLLAAPDVELLDETMWPDGVAASAFQDLDTPEDIERLGLGGAPEGHR